LTKVMKERATANSRAYLFSMPSALPKIQLHWTSDTLGTLSRMATVALERFKISELKGGTKDGREEAI